MQFLKRFCDGLWLEMAKAAIGLIEELDVWFLEQLVSNAMGVIYLQ
jgi:hypothetical protein